MAEFKYSLEALVKDLEDGRKNLGDIHLLIAGAANKQKIKDAGFDLGEKLDGPYEDVPHEITLPIVGMDAIPVILFEERLKIIRNL